MTAAEVYSELLLRIEKVEALQDQLSALLSSALDRYWMIIIGIFGFIGLALFFLSKQFIEHGIKKGTENALEELRKSQEKVEELQKRIEARNWAITSSDNGEYLVPPMSTGLEYRTFEKFRGTLPIYTMLISMGVLPLDTKKTINFESLRNVDCVLKFFATNGVPISPNAVSFKKTDNGLEVSIDSTGDMVGKDCYVQIWYTKV